MVRAHDPRHEREAAHLVRGHHHIHLTLERVHRQCAEHDGRDQRERAVKGGGMQPGSGPAGQGTCIKVQTGFRRQFAHGRSPTQHRLHMEYRSRPLARYPSK